MFWQRAAGAYLIIAPTLQPPRIADCRRCIDLCFFLRESPAIVFGPIAIGLGCIGFSRGGKRMGGVAGVMHEHRITDWTVAPLRQAC